MARERVIPIVGVVQQAPGGARTVATVVGLGRVVMPKTWVARGNQLG